MIDPQTIENLSQSSIFLVLEFAAISVVVIVTYMAMHGMFKTLKPATKMLVAIFLGSTFYFFGKLLVITILTDPSAEALVL